MSEQIRVLIVDDHALFRDGVRALLSSIPRTTVVGEAAGGEAALRLVRELHPDVILMDIDMPGMSGIEACRRILVDHPHVGIIVVTMHQEDESVFAAMRAGARGYVLKGAGQAELLRAIDAVASGEALYGQAVAERLLGFFRSSKRDLSHDAFPDLTPRELEILDLVAQGLTNGAIASRLGIAEKTVRNNVTNIFDKLQVVDRVQAVIRARAAGLGEA